MIQFNLLPDVKKEYVKAKRTKRLIMTASFVVSVASIAVVIVLFSVVQLIQKKYINDLSNDIKTETSNIQATNNLNSLLTVQNQLLLLPGLHTDKLETSRIFAYVPFFTPQEIKLGSFMFSAETSQITLEGDSDTIATVNKLVDNIKATRYSTSDAPDNLVAPFSQVSTQLSGDNEKSTFSITMVFDPVIFDNTKDIVLQLQGQSITTKVQEVNP